ncbi:hypothetical protein [Alkalihalobacillus pseudalcaliphilus]|uniref:hypothetical protein n=1 Tax=Alkalihalobacillus pseudalcaliphilus TaxID=79884 RepID=UPI00064D972E|nr:hypothetical protein [Alkalihalobacillus pseudalcaliphilus]KMK75485.1 hypothetical protein AB990_09285 [Alkalihalobacillus pseudalcaliphilus]
MFRGKAYCEANLYFYKDNEWVDRDISRKIEHLLSYQTNTIDIVDVRLMVNQYDDKHKQNFIQLAIFAEVLVPYHAHITHLNDYRINACRLLRKAYPKAGAIMAHSIDTYTPLRWKGFQDKPLRS